MDSQIRLDKYLADIGIGTRTEVKSYLKKGRVTLDGIPVKRGELKVLKNADNICFDGKKVTYRLYQYYMLNKPAGVVSATKDNLHETVIDLIETKEHREHRELFPIGRLDKDTEGLLVITNDGELTHRLLSPRNHVGKKYYAKVLGQVTLDDVKTFSMGIQLEQDFITLPAELEILSSDEISEIEVIIYEGKFHQVKRMFDFIGKKVIYLKRLSMGKLELDTSLSVGEYRELTDNEVELLKEL